MKILSVECSATPCSVTVMEEGKVLASAFTNVKLTHSQTLMPMVESVLKSALLSIGDIDAFSVSVGPGSFTGVRIGISAIKGLAQAKKLPCIPVSTLEAMTVNYSDSECYVCCVMDARCNQVYNAIFKNTGGGSVRLCEDRALAIEDLVPEIAELAKIGKPVFIVGDGAEVFYPAVKEIKNVFISDEHRRFQNATGVAVTAEKLYKEGKILQAEELQPKYLRLPQAERELKRKEEQK